MPSALSVFFAGDWLIDCQGGAERKAIKGEETSGSGAAIYIGTLLDNVPESIILGIGLAAGGGVNVAFVTAVFVANLPEGVVGSLNLRLAGYSHRHMWVLLALISVAAGWGYFITSRIPALDGLYIQAFAAGAMLTMLADAMMPEAFEHGGKLVGLFTVMGFIVVRDKKGKPRIKQMKNLTGKNALGGAFWGLFIGVLILAPWLGMLAAAGALKSKFYDIGEMISLSKKLAAPSNRASLPCFCW